MIKRETIILYILIIITFLLSGTTLTSAEDYDKYGVYVNSTKLDQAVSIHVYNNFNYIAINQLSNFLGISVKDDKLNNCLVITNKTKIIKISNGNQIKINDGPSSQMDIPLLFKENNIYFPIIAISDYLDCEVEVMDDVRCIRIKTPTDNTPVGKLVDIELNKTVAASKIVSSSYPRTAYLTFDDGLDSRITPMILDILKQHNVKATFFIVGNTIEKNKSLLKRMVEEGHSIGNHTYTHKKENIYSSAAGLQAEIEKTNAVLYNASKIVTKLFRPPYGGTHVRKNEFREVLNPYRTILWNIDSMDSKSLSVTSTEILNNVINQAKNKKSAIIIMHDSGTHIETAKALPGIIKYLKDNGFTILPIQENSSIYYQY